MTGTEQAEAHWSYVRQVLEAHGVDKATVELCGFHYKTGLAHGFKHGQEYAKEEACQP